MQGLIWRTWFIKGLLGKSQLFFTTIFTNFLVDAKGPFLSESEIDISNCQIHMPNHYLKFEILKLSSITVECCISVSVLNLIHQETNHPIMFIFFGYWLHLFCLLCSVLITKTALLDCKPPENVSCVLITWVGKFKWQSLIVKQHICLAMKMLPIFFWLYPTFINDLKLF